MLITAFTMSKLLWRDKELISVISKDTPFLLPDSVFEDTIEEEEYAFGDTVSIQIDGLDTTFIISTDSTENMFIFNTSNIYVKPSGTPKTLNQELYGVNVSSLFEHTTFEDNAIYVDSADPWELLSEMKPRVIRFPDGSGGKFSRMLGSENKDINDADYGLWNSGYGFNLTEIIPYYDMTDGTIDHAAWTAEDVVGLNVTDPDDPDWDWIYSQDVEDFITLVNHYVEQITYDPNDYTDYAGQEDEPLYINEFIKLIEKIETDNEYTVDVIICLDVLNETAEQCKAIIEYLQDNELYNVHIAGIELGNEVYAKFFGRSIGFAVYGELGLGVKTTFEHYWDYINGGDYSSFGFTSDFDLTDVLPAEMLVSDAHDYLDVFKGTTDANIYEIKIGIPAQNNGNGFAFLTGEDDYFFAGGPEDDWNEDLYDHYSEEIFWGSGYRFAFNAVILHPYYAASNYEDPEDPLNNNWYNIPLCLDDDPYTALWDFAAYDEDLRCAFDGIIGIGDEVGNFRKVITSRHKDAFQEHNLKLHFNETGEDRKELWTTESNLLDKVDGADLDVQQRLSIYSNSFVHAYFLQEWFLRNVKINFQTTYFKENFFTYSTLQNFLGGSTINLVNLSDQQNQIELDIITDCDEDKIDDYYVAKTTYHEMKLLSAISSNDLQYLPLNGVVFTGNINLVPTMFVDESEGLLYCFYTNVKGTLQNYVFDPENLISFYPYADIVLLNQTPATIYCLDADQLYSNSGRSSLFDYNTAYNDCDDLGTYLNRFELNSISVYENDPDCSGDIPTGGVCVTVPAYSCGYFTIPMYPFEMRLGKNTNIFNLIPNPASTGFRIRNKAGLELLEELDLKIFNNRGVQVKQLMYENEEFVNIADLPVGVYFVTLTNKKGETETQKLIKMQ